MFSVVFFHVNIHLIQLTFEEVINFVSNIVTIVKPAPQSTALPRFQVSQNTQASTQAHCHSNTPAGAAVLSLTREAAEPSSASL
jgi:hypothetical protein